MSETNLNQNLIAEEGSCQVCYRNVKHQRLTIRFLIGNALANVFTLERGLFYTIIKLYRNPKEVMENFISGDRYRYLNPFRFLFATAALYAIVVSYFGFSLADSMDISDKNSFMPTMQMLSDYSDIMLMSNVPFFALGSWLAFKHTKLNYAEHLVINSYAFALMTASQIPFEIVFSAFLPSIDPYWEMVTSIFMLLIFYIYISTFSNKVIPGILRTILSFIIAMFAVAALAIPIGILYAKLK
ncbi:MAG: hypothetical protein Salg2KO_20360 [Salibacteraceae bacterium]